MSRSPDQIRDHAVRCFNKLAPPKNDDGQRRQEIASNHDQHPARGLQPLDSGGTSKDSKSST